MPHENLTLQDSLFALRKNLADAGIQTAELDARLLIQAATGFDHAAVILNNNQVLQQSEISAIDKMAKRRLEHEPVSRILGEREFYGRRFQINKDVLDPRSDTETLIDQALSILNRKSDPDRQINILDVGTGSGAIIVTLLCELPQATGLATDISTAALKVAQNNAIELGVMARLTLLETTWCAGIEQKFDMIVSNPPYITTPDIKNLPVDVKAFDPVLALDGGDDGLNAYREIAHQSAGLLNTGGKIVLEIGHDQAGAVVKILTASGFISDSTTATIVKDLGNNNRVVTMLWGK